MNIFELGDCHNTYTIVGRCPRTGRLGVGIATHSLAAGGYGPIVKSGVGALSSQAYADPRLRHIAMNLLEEGDSVDVIIDKLAERDQYFEYRQFGIVDNQGNAAAHTGGKATRHAGHVIGEGFVAMGNCLKGGHVVEAIAKGFMASPDENLAERLLSAIESGRDAGGQNDPMKERSAGLLVYERESYPMVDLRVDVHDDAVTELRRQFKIYEKFIPLYYDLRVKRPDITPPQDEWIKQQK